MIPGVPLAIWNRWTAFWWMIRSTIDPRPPLADLAKRYGEPHRAYHTLEHIAHCLRELDAVRDHLDFARYGIATARRGWLTAERCINCWSATRLAKWVRRG